MGSDGEYAVGNDWSTSFHFCVLKISLLCFPFFFFFPSIVFLLIVVINYSYYLPSPISEVPGRVFQTSFLTA